MTDERPRARRAVGLFALCLAMAAAIPAGWALGDLALGDLALGDLALGDWALFGGGDLAADLARRWMLVPALALLLLAGAVVTRCARSRLWLLAPVLVVALMAAGAWQAVAARADAYREGPLNAAL